ncbi:aminotransferase class III-fold pyridoxal phosphate-dependent enzyme [uncultured Desulfosarcina sp.]|uniref:aminotransferase class III-fold pyridoxal phosphate-dependent enzyme n=1 Tax=uncultured Desulfosarcina sp. TaxID=218289 RepID=UPI0029C8E590|nr:aminotransferase class III-fold pyridoxal phosphate-dependent enzyme [uncultured Desulfosarcina sp.]
MRSYQDALDYSAKWLEIVKRESTSIDEATAKWMSQETKQNFVNHFNAGWVNYRKSMTEAGDYGAIEWRGEGARFYDNFGNEYLDFLGGYGALDLGWSHPEVVEAVRAQALRSGIPSQELMDPLRGVLAKLMSHITPGDIDHSFFVASGTEAVEGALKIARLHTRRHSFISTVKAFHGKTSGSLSVMGKKDFRAPLQPYGAQIFFVPFGDADALEQQLEICESVGIDIAGFVAEPIQGEAGAIIPSDDYWPRVREICDRFGILMICDEVQTGLGRTGALWGVDHWNVKPDIMMAAKSLGGGVMPVGCFMGSGKIWKAFEEPNPFMHTTTTGGNPMACAAAIATIQVTLRDNLPQRAAELGDYFIGQLNQMSEAFPGIYEKITGKGLLIGQHFIDDEIGYKVAAGLFRRNVLVAGTLVNAKAIRFEPPLVVTREEIDEVLNRLQDTLKSVSKTA